MERVELVERPHAAAQSVRIQSNDQHHYPELESRRPFETNSRKLSKDNQWRLRAFIADNASTDGSHDYLRQLESQGVATVVFMQENTGGDAFNQAFPLTHGDLLYFSANDLIFLPGWSEHAVAAFETFSDLGQLSLFADVPTDDEAWAQKPAHVRLSKGKILYEAHGNVSASSLLRASLFHERGLRVATLENGPLRFPADGKLSLDIKAAGYWCAWSDRYYVRNVGHEVAEFEADPVYYQENYANKPWLGIEGWETRVALQKAQPKVDRKSIIFGNLTTGPQRGGTIATGKIARLGRASTLSLLRSRQSNFFML